MGGTYKHVLRSHCIAFASSSFLGEVHFARGDIAAAIAAYERFLELSTNPRRERIADAKLRRMRTKLRGTR
jgi:cytochrome c-type biogenesis protein CcmH/NrfG